MKYCNRCLVYSPYCYALCKDEKAFRRELKRLGILPENYPAFLDETMDACVHFINNDDGTRIAIVCIGGWSERSTAEKYALLAHEAVHIWQAIKEEISETNPSPEFEAYSIQAITQNLIEAYEK